MIALLKRWSQSHLARSSVVYWLGSAASGGLAIVLLPIFTRYLSTADYGMISMFVLVIAFFEPCTHLTVNSAIARRFFDPQEKQLSSYVGTALQIILICTAVMLLLVTILQRPLVSASFLPYPWLLAAVILAAFNGLIAVCLSLLQSSVRPGAYVTLDLTRAMLGLGMGLVLVVMVGLDWQGQTGGTLAGTFLAGILAWFFLKRFSWLSWNWRHDARKHLLSYSLPLMPHMFGSLISVMANRFMLAHMSGVAATGIYTAAAQLAAVVQLIQDGFNRAVTPWIFEKLTDASGEAKWSIVKLTYIYNVVILLTAIVLGLSLQMVTPWLLPASYHEAGPVIFWISLAWAFDGMYKMSVNHLFYHSRTGIISSITFTSGLLNIGLNFIFIPWNGAVGAGQAMAITNLVTFIVVWCVSQRLAPLPWLGLRGTRFRD